MSHEDYNKKWPICIGPICVQFDQSNCASGLTDQRHPIPLLPAIADAQPLRSEGPLYLSLDLDCLDPAFAPGVSHYEPGGFSVRDVLGIIHSLPSPPVGADIVELNPRRDEEGLTAAVGAKLLKEILARMLE